MDEGRPPKRPLDTDGSTEPAAKRPATGVAAALQIAKAKAVAMAKARAAAIAASIAGKGAVASVAAPAAPAAAITDEERRKKNAEKKTFIPDMDLSSIKMTRLRKRNEKERHLKTDKPVSAQEQARIDKEQARERLRANNPYLAHWDGDSARVKAPAEILDERVNAGGSSRARRRRGAKALHFVEEGTVVAEAEDMRARLEARALATEQRRGVGTAFQPALVDEAADVGGAGAGGKAPQGAATAAAAEAAAGLPAAVAACLAALPPRPRHSLPVPSVEPWDVALLPQGARRKHAEAASKHERGRGPAPAPLPQPQPGQWSDNVRTLGLVELPVPVAPAVPQPEPAPLPLMLTRAEKKKARRKRRAEREEDRRLQQILGNLRPDAGKIKVSTLVKTMLDDATANPTALEASARAAEAERRGNHDARNLARKLTPEEKRERQRRKLEERDGEATSVALFRVLDLSLPSLRFKVGENAKQLYLSGRAVMCPHERVTMVVVEGGAKAVRAFQQLMLRRVPWRKQLEEAAAECRIAAAEAAAPGATEAAAEAAGKRADTLGAALRLRDAGLLDVDEEDETAAGGLGSAAAPPKSRARFCELVWTGSIAQRCFEEFRFEVCRGIGGGRASMARAGHPEWWDMVVGAADRAGVRPTIGATDAAAASAAKADLPDLDDLLG